MLFASHPGGGIAISTGPDQLAIGLLEAAPDAIVGVNAEGQIVLVNAQAERLFGYPRDELVGQAIELLVPEEVRPIHPGRRNGYVADPRPRPMGAGIELAGRRRDGTEFPAEISLSAINSEDGVVVAAAVRDVTDRKRAEAKFRGLLEAAPDAIVGVDADGQIVLVNAQAERLFGYPRDELIGQAIELLVPESVRAVHPSRRDGYLADSQPRPMGAGMELAGRRRDGTEFPTEISLSAIDSGEGIVVAAAVRDVTDRKRIEQQLREKNVELEKASKAKNNFLASMSHELRTPLNAIIGFTGTLLMRLPGPLNEDQERQLHTVQDSGRHLLMIINDLLDLAKIESGTVQISLSAVDCGQVAVGVMTSLQPLANEKGLALSAEVADCEVVVRSDARALSQILINLVNNAIKFTETGAVRVCVREPRNGTPAQIAVLDTGSGIEPDDLHRIFAAFERGSERVGPSKEGTGLGLHIAQKLSELIGATITVESSPGVGSSFVVSLGSEAP